MPLQIIRTDLARIKADAIVNSTNVQPFVGYGVDSRLHEAAGPELLEARKRIGTIRPGESVPTPAFHLPAKWVIHTVGPLWEGGNAQEEETLASCYAGALLWAEKLECESIAFPLISTGTLGFPKDIALRVATDVIRHHLMDSDLSVYLVVYDPASFVYSEAMFEDVEVRMTKIDEYLSKRFVAPSFARYSPVPESHRLSRHIGMERVVHKQSMQELSASYPIESSALPVMREQRPAPLHKTSDRHEPRADTFSVKLFDWIETKGMKPSDCYRRANVDKRLFSKILLNMNYQPKKNTALAFCVSLHLDLEETQDLIGRAGYCLSSSLRFDLIVMDFIKRKHFDVFDINNAIHDEDENLPLLGSK
jgi:O-acetyl-ADP-ribose deacetylase (regulator of RNase III)